MSIMQSHTVVEVDKISHSLKNSQNTNVFLVNNTKNKIFLIKNYFQVVIYHSQHMTCDA